MKTFRSQVISLGRITIPKEVRDELDLQEGDYVQVEDIKKLVPEAAEDTP